MKWCCPESVWDCERGKAKNDGEMKDPLILKRENRSSATATGQGPFSHFRNGIARRCLPYVRNEPRRANETSGNDREALPRIRNRYRGQELDRRLETRCTDHGRRRLQNDFVVLVDVHVDLRNRNRPLQLILETLQSKFESTPVSTQPATFLLGTRFLEALHAQWKISAIT